MQAKIQKWGNSLGIRIPKNIAADVQVTIGSHVELIVENGRLVILPRRAAEISLEGLLAGITPENLHGETDTGSLIGSEVW